MYLFGYGHRAKDEEWGLAGAACTWQDDIGPQWSWRKYRYQDELVAFYTTNPAVIKTTLGTTCHNARGKAQSIELPDLRVFVLIPPANRQGKDACPELASSFLAR